MNVIIHEKKWLHIGLFLLIGILGLGVLKALIPAAFLKKVTGTVQEIQQKYSAEGDKKLILISFKQQPLLKHSYVNKDYLPSPQVSEIKEQSQLVTYISRNGGDRFYGLELTDGTLIQSKRWDLLSAYLNHSFVIFTLMAIPIGLYLIYGKKLLQYKRDWIGFAIYALTLAFVWGKLHIFLMILLVIGLIQIGKRLSKQKDEQVTNDIDLPAQT
ncbi:MULTISPECIES: hypothetical protein [Olivibacter]|jgi:hypothetical protein|uniref:PepSY-associated transmembrane protein n=1 Tax=Olivibacter oleidegradans TaxID=760123 RepID=A0ABV6HI62_9SPHI|nr:MULTISPECIES: hypothetical protein [Olivibacter]MDM8174665.1 hypothetical protein [Olivibacter sp. 47]QEL01460.1 hypothetical protein FKG96_11780 [Olivibacter sp. LS-1]